MLILLGYIVMLFYFYCIQNFILCLNKLLVHFYIVRNILFCCKPNWLSKVLTFLQYVVVIGELLVIDFILLLASSMALYCSLSLSFTSSIHVFYSLFMVYSNGTINETNNIRNKYKVFFFIYATTEYVGLGTN